MISCRDLIKNAGIEMTQSGIGVSTSARLYIRKTMPEAAQMPNAELNEQIASEFSKGEPVHRFKLKTGEIAEIRKTSNMYFVAKVSGRGTADAGYHILVIQSSYKTPSNEGFGKKRLEPGWGVE